MIATTRLCISGFLVFLLVGCGGSGSGAKKSTSSSVSSAPASSSVSSIAASQSSAESSALGVSSESTLSSAPSSQAGTDSSSSSLSSSFNSSQQSSSITFTIEFKPPVIGAQESLTQKIGQFFIPAAHAASTARLKLENFALVRINLTGVVQEIAQLPAEAITENADGSWVISWAGKKSIDWLVVADVTKPLSLNVGDPLTGARYDLIYAPLTSSYVDVDIASTESYFILLKWIVNGNYADATFENTSVNVQDESVVTLFESLLNSSQLQIDEQAMVANSIEEYRDELNFSVVTNLADQIKNAEDPLASSLVHRFQAQLNTSNSIVGAWSVCDWALGNCRESWLIFTPEGVYVSIQTTQPDEGCKSGIEVGAYTLSQETGSFKPTIITDGNDHCGVSDAGDSASIMVNGMQFSYKESQSSQGVPFVKIPNSSNLMGTWISSANNKIEVLSLLDTNSFIFATVDINTGVSDLEQGGFEYENATGSFTITEWKQKSGNDADGFSGTKTIKLNTTDDLLTITTDLDPSPTKAYKRLQ